MAKKHLLKNGCFFVIKILKRGILCLSRKPKKAAERKSPANAGRHKNGKLSTKEVKNGHIAEGKNPVKPEESDCKAFCDFDDSFHDFCPFSGGLAAARRPVGDYLL